MRLSHLPCGWVYDSVSIGTPAAVQKLHTPKQVRQTLLQPFGDLLDGHQRDIPNPSLDAAVVRPMQSALFRSLFLIDFLLLANAADRAAKRMRMSRAIAGDLGRGQPMRKHPMSHIFVDSARVSVHDSFLPGFAKCVLLLRGDMLRYGVMT